ncbi:MAG: MauE/DoxX family redox-associated membrane protein [Planctomycetota bacterium]
MRGNSWLHRLNRTGLPLLVVRLVVGGLFVYMGILKIRDPANFLKLVRLYHVLPESPPYFLNTTAVVLPWLEVMTGLVLILGLWRRGAGAIAALMLAVFTPAIFLRTLAIQHETGTSFFLIKFDCGCGSGPVTAWLKLLENTGLFALALYMLFSAFDRFGLDALRTRRRVTSENEGQLTASAGDLV